MEQDKKALGWISKWGEFELAHQPWMDDDINADWRPLFTRQQVIEELAGKNGVMPISFPAYRFPEDQDSEDVCETPEVREALATMQARVEQLEKDAARYRLLRSWDVRAHGLYVTNGKNPIYDMTLDNLLDAAMKGKQP